MIEWVSNWAEQIIVAVVIAGIIEMILPSGNNKKYIKAVIGVYILFTIISPIISKFSNIDLKDIDFETYFEQTDTYQTMSQNLETDNDKSIEEIYVSNLKQDMKNKLKEKGYVAESINLDIEFEDTQNYGRINKIYLDVYQLENTKEDEDNIKESTTSINKIEKITIGNTIANTTSTTNKKILSSNKKYEIKEYLSNIYDVNKKNINFNE